MPSKRDAGKRIVLVDGIVSVVIIGAMIGCILQLIALQSEILSESKESTIESAITSTEKSVTTFFDSIETTRSRISGTVKHGIITTVSDTTPYTSDMYRLFVDSPRFLALYNALPDRNVVKVHRESFGDDGVTPVVKWMRREYVNATHNTRWDNVFVDPAEPWVTVPEESYNKAYDPFAKSWYKLAMTLEEGGHAWIGPSFQSYTGVQEPVLEMVFKERWPKASGDTYSVFKLKLLIGEISKKLDEIEETSLAQILVANKAGEVVAISSSFGVAQVVEDASLEDERRFVTVGEIPLIRDRFGASIDEINAALETIADAGAGAGAGARIRALESAGEQRVVSFASSSHTMRISSFDRGNGWNLIAILEAGQVLESSRTAQDRLLIIMIATIILLSAYAILGIARTIIVRRNSHARFKAVFDAANEGIMILDCDGSVRDHNTAATSIFGTSVQYRTIPTLFRDPRTKLDKHAAADATSAMGNASKPVVARHFDNLVCRMGKAARGGGGVSPYTVLPVSQGDGGGDAVRVSDLDALAVVAGASRDDVPVSISMAPMGGGANSDVVVVARDIRKRKELENRVVENGRLTEAVLHACMPVSIANRLVGSGASDVLIADGKDDCSVLFLDIVKFTDFAKNITPKELVSLLSDLYSAIDEDIDAVAGLEKVKTVGDAVIVVGNCVDPSTSHVLDMVRLAETLRKTLTRVTARKLGTPMECRIGVHVGAVVTGVVGKLRRQWDVFGDTVNTASRMESSGTPGRTQVSEAVYERLRSNATVSFEKRGTIHVKGRGDMTTYFVSSSS